MRILVGGRGKLGTSNFRTNKREQRFARQPNPLFGESYHRKPNDPKSVLPVPVKNCDLFDSKPPNRAEKTCRVFLTSLDLAWFESVDKILKCGYSNESCWEGLPAVLLGSQYFVR